MCVSSAGGGGRVCVLRVWCAWCVCPAGGVGVAVSADGRCVCGVSVVCVLVCVFVCECVCAHVYCTFSDFCEKAFEVSALHRAGPKEQRLAFVPVIL